MKDWDRMREMWVCTWKASSRRTIFLVKELFSSPRCLALRAATERPSQSSCRWEVRIRKQWP